jgi:hypothetical protein
MAKDLMIDSPALLDLHRLGLLGTLIKGSGYRLFTTTTAAENSGSADAVIDSIIPGMMKLENIYMKADEYNKVLEARKEYSNCTLHEIFTIIKTVERGYRFLSSDPIMIRHLRHNDILTISLDKFIDELFEQGLINAREHNAACDKLGKWEQALRDNARHYADNNAINKARRL